MNYNSLPQNVSDPSMSSGCHNCGRVFFYEWEMQQHNCHFPKFRTKFRCDQCHYETYRRYDMEKHYRTHSGVRPYVCSQCPAKFANSSNLKVHIRKFHNKFWLIQMNSLSLKSFGSFCWSWQLLCNMNWCYLISHGDLLSCLNLLLFCFMSCNLKFWYSNTSVGDFLYW